ncbi:hypothetical protein C2E23DRAFT_730613 [Lenzites betulinus]|nr:hypothetical protein C2E23DRAFT_730613 [Lenzites betulinus]
MFKNAARKIAHNTTMPGLVSAKQDLRALQDLITAEKSILNSLQKLSTDFLRASEALKAWGQGEGEDLTDTLGASTTLLLQFSSALSTFANRELTVRDQMKSVRAREEALDEMKRRRKSVFNDSEAAERKLSKMNPDNKNIQQQTDLLNRLRDEIRSMDADIMNEEAALSDFKRFSARSWMGLKFGGLLECCEKGAIAGELGKLVISEIPTEQTQPGLPRAYYSGHARIEFLLAEATRSISEVPYSPDPNPHPSQRTIRPLPGQELPPLPDSDLLQRPSSIISGSTQPGYSYTSPPPGAYPGLPQVEEGGFNIQQFIGADPQSTPPSTFPPVNEFGGFSGPSAPQTHSLGPAERASSPRGGRFATFPVKALGPRPPPGAAGGSSFSMPSTNPYIAPPPMRDGDRAPSLDIDRNDDSFSSSVLGQFGMETPGSASGSAPAPPQAGSSRFSATQAPQPQSQDVKGDFGPQRYSPPPPMYTPAERSSLPPGAAPPNPPTVSNSGLAPQSHDQLGGSRPHSMAEEGDGLAYMINEANESNESLSDSGDRRVRFGGVSDVDQEMEKRHAEQEAAEAAAAATAANPGAPAAQRAQSPPIGQSYNDAQPWRTSAEASRSSAFSNKDVPPPPTERLSSPPSPSAPRIPSPPPAQDPLDEHALNAAAAREVSRELDALMMSSPPVSPTNKAPASPPWSARGQSTNPYQQQAVSPRPSLDPALSGGPPGPSLPNSPKLEGMYVRQRDRSASSSVARLPQYPPPPPAPAPETIPAPASPSGSFDSGDQMQRSFSGIPRTGPSPAPTAGSNGTPFRTPLETPLAGPPTGSLYNLPGMSGSNTSFSAGGVRTISAAAFRRPVRVPSVPVPEGGRQSPSADTTPLNVKKRPLPSSPHPSPYPGANLQVAAPGGMPRSVSASAAQDQYRYGGLGVNDAQEQRPLTHYRQDDDFDYISAYTESAPGEGEQAHSPGYRQGRFATNLDDGNGVL